MMTNFIADFKESQYFKTFFDDPNIILAFIAGSRSTGLEDSNSDYDIVVIRKSGSKFLDKGLYLMYENKAVHFYYLTFKQFLSNYYTATGSLVSLFQFIETTKKSLLFENPAYKGLIKKLFEKQFSLGQIAQLKFAKNYDDLITEVVNTQSISPERYSKIIYHLVYISNRLSHIANPKQKLTAIKHCSETDLTLEEQAYVVERLSNLKYFIDNYSMEDLVAKMAEETKSLLELEAELNEAN